MKKYTNISFKENRLLFRYVPVKEDNRDFDEENLDRNEFVDPKEHIEDEDSGIKKVQEDVRGNVDKVLDEKKNEREAAGISQEYDDEKFKAPTEGWWKRNSRQTELLTLYDLYILAKEFGESIIETLKESDKYRRAKVAQGFYGDYGSEATRRVDEGENKKIENRTNDMKELNINQIKEKIYNTRDKFRMYAGLDLLAEKGQIPFDSPRLVKALNGLGSHSLEVADSTNKVAPSDVVELLNKIYSEDTGTKFQNKNTSNYQTDDFEKANENLRNIKDGHAKKLEYMMMKFEQGDYVDPREYEAVLRLMMKSVKGTLEEQLFYFIKGLVQKNSNGETLLPYERAFKISSGLTEMPFMKYFKQKSSKLNYEVYSELFEKISYTNGQINFNEAKRYLYTELAQFGGIQGFVSAVLNTGNTSIDMDMLHYYSPILAHKEIKSYLKQKSKGTWAYNQPEDYAFGLFGYGTYINQLTSEYLNVSKESKREGLVNNICNAFVGGAMLEGGLAGNYLKKEKDVKRFTNRDELYAATNHNIDNPDKSDKSPPKVSVFMDSMYDALEEIASYYGDARFTNLVYRIKYGVSDLTDDDYDSLYVVMTGVIAKDNGEKMIAYLSTHKIQEF